MAFSIIPRYVAFTATASGAANVTGLTANATGPLFTGLEVEGFGRQIEAIETQIEDGQTSLDAMTVTVSGYVRGTGLLGATSTLNFASATGARNVCNMFMLGAPGTRGFYVNNIQINAVYDTVGQKERVMFKGTKTFVRDINSTGADVGFFTS